VGSYVPPQWPDAVPPPGTDGWEQAAVRWLTGIIPPRYWDVPVLRQYPAALAALACHHTMARLTAIRDSYRTVRIDLGAHLPPQAIPGEVLDVHLHEGGRLRDDAEATELVSRALRGELFSPFP
jgi:hypothetical protein